MKIDQESLKKVCGESTTAVVFGFGKYDYVEVCEEINKHGITAFHSDDYSIANLDLQKDNPYSMYGLFKLILNDLFLENYKKKKEGKPLVPLIFVVGKSDATYDPKQIAKREEGPDDKWTTLTELRRVYKLVTEFGPEFSQTALDTIKFVRLDTQSNVTQLELVTPFWESEDWKNEWANRKEEARQTHGRGYKNSIWRTNLKEKIQEIDNPNHDEGNKEESKP